MSDTKYVNKVCKSFTHDKNKPLENFNPPPFTLFFVYFIDTFL